MEQTKLLSVGFGCCGVGGTRHEGRMPGVPGGTMHGWRVEYPWDVTVYKFEDPTLMKHLPHRLLLGCLPRSMLGMSNSAERQILNKDLTL